MKKDEHQGVVCEPVRPTLKVAVGRKINLSTRKLLIEKRSSSGFSKGLLKQAKQT